MILLSGLFQGLEAALVSLPGSVRILPALPYDCPTNWIVDLARKEGEVIVWGQAGDIERDFFGS